ncbi:glycoside hydrolase/deacetylase, partial [Anaeromyces robustus]
TSSNGRCGPKFSNAICPSGQCCSKYGWCGTESKYCGDGCQIDYGTCKNNNSSTKTSKINHPTSTNGRCGINFDNTACPIGECCSKHGWCGNSSDYCGEGCQSEFGECNGNNETGSKPKIRVYEKCKNSKHWALTFDDGPYKYDEALLEYLDSVGVKATFFINGANVMDIYSEKGRRIIKKMYKSGHVIGNHTFNHKDLDALTVSEIKDQVTKLEKALKEIIGVKPAFIRPPYGSGDDNPTVIETLQNLGYTGIIMWNVDTLDWDNKGDIDYAISEFNKKLSKPIISLNHCYYGGITESKLVTQAKKEIEYMKSNGYTPVTMAECLGL